MTKYRVLVTHPIEVNGHSHAHDETFEDTLTEEQERFFVLRNQLVIVNPRTTSQEKTVTPADKKLYAPARDTKAQQEEDNDRQTQQPPAEPEGDPGPSRDAGEPNRSRVAPPNQQDVDQPKQGKAQGVTPSDRRYPRG